MISHTSEFTAKDALKLLGWPCLVMVLFAAALHGAARLGLLPPPRPTLDVDRTILVHQAEASRSPQTAEVLLLGDSSCLMDVSAPQLAQRLSRPVLNLGTFSYLDLRAYASLLREYVRANPDRLRAMVLLVHPETLRRPAPEGDYVEFLQDFYSGRDSCRSARPYDRLSYALGLEILKGRVLARLVPASLPGAFGHRYGFTADLEGYLHQHHGSLLEPKAEPFEGNAEYRLAPGLEPASREFQTAVPAGAKLFLAITPVPEGFALPGYSAQHRQMLEQWRRWLGDAGALSDLPGTLPDGWFARTTHLNEEGVSAYTDRLAQSLLPRLQ
jgi:hypothetical protein